MATLQTRERAVAALSPAESIVARCLPSFGDILFACVLFGVVFGLQGRALGPDGDAGWSLRIGLQTLSSGLPRTEFLLSTTAGQPAVYWEWLAQVSYALAYRLAGLNGVVALAGGIVAATGVGLYAAIRRRGTPLLLALALAVAGIGLTSITWTARAQLFSLPLTLWWSENLWSYWRTGNTRRLWYFLPAMALWANLHGGFLAGILLLATAVAVAWLFPNDSAQINRRHLTYALGGTLLATLLTPWGLALPAHILAYMRNPLITRYTQEYQSPDFHSLAGLLFLALALLLAATWIYAARTARVPLLDTDTPNGAPIPGGSVLALASAGGWTALACISVRFVPLWALLVLPLLGGSLAGARGRGTLHEAASWPPGLARVVAWGRRAEALSRRLEVVDAQVGRGVWSALAVAVVVVVLAGGGRFPGASTPALHTQFDATLFPVAAAQRLHTEGLPAGRGFTTYEWGGYLDFALPEYHVFLDSRSDAYSQQLLQDYATIISLGPNWRGLLRQYGIRWALLPAMSPLAQVLALSAGWRCTAADDVGVASLCVLSAA